MLLESVLLCLFTRSIAQMDPSSASSIEQSAEFDCARVPSSYCCTTRVRLTCMEQCYAIRCDNEFYERVLASISPNNVLNSSVRFSFAKSQIPATSNISIATGNNLDKIAVGSRTIYVNGLNDGDTADSHSGVKTDRVTLPPIKNIFTTLIDNHKMTTTTATTTALTTEVTVSSAPERNAVLPNAFIFSFTTSSEQTSPKTLPQKRLDEKRLPAPTSNDENESLVSLKSAEDYDSVAKIAPPRAVPIEVPSATLPVAFSTPLATPMPQTLFIAGRPPKTFVSAQVRTDPGERPWELRSLKIVRHITPAPKWMYRRRFINPNSELELLPQWNVELERGINALLGAYFATRRPLSKKRKTATLQNRIIYTTQKPRIPIRKEQSFDPFGITNVPNTVPISRSQLLWTTRIPPIITNSLTAPCGVAPDFLPCIPITQANFHFGQCCRNKLLPAGCQNLCRYDVTESEIKSALDMGSCGILHVAPIVECASDGRDNSECCKYKEVTSKSAPQCEVFCHSGQEIKGLGLQHLVCRKVMKELIACHLSGLRI